MLLIAVGASLGACYMLSKRSAERKITVVGHVLSLPQQYGLVAVFSFPLFYLAGAGAAVFWVLGIFSYINIQFYIRLPEKKSFFQICRCIDVLNRLALHILQQ
jgi:hypothetical protein